jgi:hypothetical protein
MHMKREKELETGIVTPLSPKELMEDYTGIKIELAYCLLIDILIV